MYNPQDAANMVTGGISNAAGAIGQEMSKEKEKNTPLSAVHQKYLQMVLDGKMDPREAAMRAKLVSAGHSHVDIGDGMGTSQGLGGVQSMPPPQQAPTLGPPTFQQQFAPDSMGPGLGATQMAAMQARPVPPGASIGGGASINGGPGLGVAPEKPWTRQDAADLLPLIPHLQRQDNYANQMAMLQYKQAEMDARQRENLGVKKTEGEANRGSREKNTNTMAGAGITRSTITANQSDTNSQRTFQSNEDRIAMSTREELRKGATQEAAAAKAIVNTFDANNRTLVTSLNGLAALAQTPEIKAKAQALTQDIENLKKTRDQAIQTLDRLSKQGSPASSSSSVTTKTPSKFINGQVYTSSKTGKRGRWSDDAKGFIPVE